MRVAAIADATNWLLDNALQPRRGGLVDALVFPILPFAVDLAFVVGFVAVTIWSRRTWLAAMTAFLLLGVANYASYFGELHLWHRAFITASYLWGYGALACLVAGARHAQRSRRPNGWPAS